jgi:spore maturation protein CgeB
VNLLILGKLGAITHWTEDCVAGLRAGGHHVRLAVTRNPALHPALERTLAFRPARIAHAVRRWRPDLILAINAYAIPLPVLRRVATLRGRPPLIAWIGDLMHGTDREAARLFDLAAYADSGLLQRHRALGFGADCLFLPHAASPRLTAVAATGRHPGMVFVASPTPGREALIRQIRQPVCLYGRGWSRLRPSLHDIQDRRVAPRELPSIYGDHRAVLNIRNEANVLDGLNQRHFDAAAAGAVPVSDEQPDLSACFDPGREALTYRDADELNAINDRLRGDPHYAAGIAAAAQRRTLAEHTYAKRLEALLKAL